MEIGIQIVSEIRQELETILDRCGIMYRLFARGKSKDSIEHKINAVPGKYTPTGKKIQDGINPIPTSTFNFRRHPSAIAAAVSELTTPYWSIVLWGIPNNFSFALAA